MGRARWSAGDWKSYTTSTTAGRSREEIFTRKSHNVREDFDPKNIQVREARDSEVNPNSNAIIVAFDQTGSMGDIPYSFIQKGLGTMVQEILDREPVTDPHVMIMAFGDAWTDRHPLQVTQFETDIRIAEQLKDMYLEGHGGGNRWESYNLPWYFAARRTSIDCFEKRNKKGYLFTVGDEPPPPNLEARHVQKFLGETIQDDLDSRDILVMVERKYHVYHVIVEQGNHASRHPVEVREGWNNLLDQRVLRLTDYHKLAECVVSTIEINEGNDVDSVVGSWSGDTSMVVATATQELMKGGGTAGAESGVVRFGG